MATSKRSAVVKAETKLKKIEDNMFHAGNLCVNAWEANKDIASLRMAVSTYRTSMQAMRDQARYKAGRRRS